MTVVHRTPLDVFGHQLQGAKRLPFSSGLFRTTASSAMIESETIEAGQSFDRLVGSWNADVPPEAMLEMQAKVRLEAGWTGWFNLAAAKGAQFQSAPTQETDAGLVDVDTLALKRPATAFRYRYLLSAPRRPITLRLAAVTVSSGAPAAPAPFASGPWMRELKLKPRSQMEEQERYKNDVCSPTSLAMVMEFWGRRLPTAAVAEGVRDRQTRIFGHWPFNAAFAGNQKGLEGYVSYLSGLEELQDFVGRGRPVIASLTFGLGELEGAPLRRTQGHLVVVAGFTPRGDVIVFDPAAPDRGSVRRVYDRIEFNRAWMVNKRGVAYLVGPLRGCRFRVAAPVADLMAKPTASRKPSLHDPLHLSQLLYGESVTVHEVKGAWVKALADEQPVQAGDWRGYPGWLRAEALLSERSPALRADCVVRTRQALLQRGQDMLILSVGTRLPRLSEEKGLSVVELLGGEPAEIATDSLYPLPDKPTDESRSEIIKTAELFLGTSYYWGGRSGVQQDLSIGVDCSGLVDLAYRVHGLDLPRDSHDQWVRARPIRRSRLKLADLIFLTEPGRPAKISHVMIYTGGDGVIESRKSSGRVLRSSFKERFGKPVSKLESGQWVQDFSYPRPRRRRLYFGTYF